MKTPSPAIVALALAGALAWAVGCSSEPSESPEPATDSGSEPAAETGAAPEAPAPAAEAAAGAGDVVARQELEGGLVIEDLVIGEGSEVPPGATVTIDYVGRLTDGTEFDSSYRRGEPATFPLGRLIEGWQKGIPGMKPGGKRRLLIPYQMGYGERGAPPAIPPRADLVFEIELHDFQ
ncbi:MAG: FKBP-type peptidyl-prolyl cis-trans isomerase [Phycisphaerales bacterium JB039]